MKRVKIAAVLSLIIANPLMALTSNYVVLSHKEYAPKSMQLKISDLPLTNSMHAKKLLAQQQWRDFGVSYNLEMESKTVALNTPTTLSTFIENYLENNSNSVTVFEVKTYVCPFGINSAFSCTRSTDFIELQPNSFAEFRKAINIEVTYTELKNVDAMAFTTIQNEHFNYNSMSQSDAIIAVREAK